MAPPQPATPGFEVERFGWTAAGGLEVTGRWYGVRGRRFVRPTLDVAGSQGRRRLLASLEHKPWAPAEGEPWIAAFPWEGADPGHVTVELAVAPGVVVALPPLGDVPRAGTARRPPTASIPSGEPGDAAAALLRRLATLRREHAAMTAERDAARSAQATAGRERDEALVVRERVERERDEALAARDATAATPLPSAAPGGAALERLEHQRDALVGELEAMKHERGAARRERNELLSGTDATLAARVAAERERDEAVAQRAAAVKELQAARSQGAAAPQQAPARATEPAGFVATPEAELRLTRALTVVVIAVFAVLAALLLGVVL
ncbi:MAG: hypothetical protein M3469_01605 [Actinomycetota bacterium]|nr:hypothetical protein [Actinomycetota bacterium]